MNKILKCSEGYGLSLYIEQTKFMKISNNNYAIEVLIAGGEPIQIVKNFPNLGKLITEKKTVLQN